MKLKHFLDIVEIRTKLISVSTYTLATLYAQSDGVEVGVPRAVLLLLAVLCVDMGTTAFNSFFDYYRGVDNPLFVKEADKVLIFAGVAPGHAFIVSVLLYMGAGIIGLVLAFAVHWWVIPAGFLGMLAGYLYNGGPLPISRTPLGELASGGFLGTFLFVVVYRVYAPGIDWSVAVAGLPSMLVIAAVLTTNNTCDMEGDRAAGRRTLSILVGQPAGEALIYLQGAAAYALLIAAASGVVEGAWMPELPILAIPLLAAGFITTLGIYRKMRARGFSHETKTANMKSVLQVVVVFTLAYAGSILIKLAG